MSVDLSWSEDSRQSHDLNLGLSGHEFHTLEAVAGQLSDELGGAPSIGRNSDVHQVIRGIINGSLEASEVESVETESPDSSIKTSLSLSDEEYQIIRDSANRSNLRASDYNRRPLCRKVRQRFVQPFLLEIEE